MPPIRRLTTRSQVLIACLVIGVLTAGWSSGSEDSGTSEEAKQSVSLPSPEALVARYVEALGGAEAIRQHTSLHVKGRVELPHLKLEGEIEQFSAAPNRYYMVFEVPGMGSQVEGHDGKVGWRLEKGVHARIVEGRELKDMLLSADFYPELNYSANFSQTETVGRTEFAGVDCYEVRLETEWGEKETHYFATDSGLLRGRETWNGPPDSGFAVIEEIVRYEKVGDRLFPKELKQKFAGIEQLVELTTIEFDGVPDTAFQPPDAVSRLLDEREGGAS